MFKMDSILNSIKKMIGGSAEGYDHFDTDLIIHINTALNILKQLGVGNSGFVVTGPNETWTDFCDDVDLDMLKTYVYIRVRLLFDPPQGSMGNSLQETLDMLEWRLNVGGDKTRGY
jgi:hypothetical protein